MSRCACASVTTSPLAASTAAAYCASIAAFVGVIDALAASKKKQIDFEGIARDYVDFVAGLPAASRVIVGAYPSSITEDAQAVASLIPYSILTKEQAAKVDAADATLRAAAERLLMSPTAAALDGGGRSPWDEVDGDDAGSPATAASCARA